MKPGSRIAIAMLLGLMLSGLALAAQQTTPPAASSDNATAITSSQSSPPSVTDSQVRIVRLSDATGEVQMDRNIGRGFEPALLNMPVTQGARLRTGSGFAEIEFEDNSTLRLAPNTVVEVPQLELRQSGATASTVNLLSGTVYVSLARDKGNEITLAFGNQKILLAPSSHIRLHLGPTRARLAVFRGNAQVDGPTNTVTVSKNKTLSFDLANPVQPVLTKGLAQGRYDYWDRAAIDFHDRNVKSSAYGSSPYVYGLTDMNYYGSFVNAAGCGELWRPYFASAAWDPFANGAWVWYAGSGYSWVSPYPWGWTPYHYGAWQYCPNYGWGWQPRGHWRGINNLPKPSRHPRPHYPPLTLPRPPKPPAPGAPTVVAVNRKPMVASGLSSADKFVIRQDSAGLGVPRTLGKLNHISGEVEQHGSANIAVHSAPMIAGNGSNSHPGYIVSAERGSTGRSGGASYSSGRSSAASYSSGTARSSSASDTGRGSSGSMSMGGGGGSSGGGRK
jgi:uncharacterized protein DUF6600/FecR-like protein